MNYKAYVLSTIAYGLFALIGFAGLIYFLMNKNYFLALICLAIFYVSLDNFFCGARLEKTGKKVKSHYAVPPFLRKK